jgi:hypothetical protein
MLDTFARSAAIPLTELRAALERRKLEPLTPYRADAWECLLREAGLLTIYPDIVPGLRSGFDAHIPRVRHSSLPPNAPGLENDPDFHSVAEIELRKGRWIGPADIHTIESIIGPIQSSPCSVIPKPRNPQKKRLVQNFSYPRVPRDGILSINSSISISNFPCTWGTPWAMGAMVWSLPSRSQIAIRDVKSAYRTVPLRPDQWNGSAIRLSAKRAAIDICGTFGCVSSGGLFGRIADALCDLMRHYGIGPILKWVDDFVFARLHRNDINEYNRRQAQFRERILERHQCHPQPEKQGGRTWFQGNTYSDGTADEFVEDFRFPIRDLGGSQHASSADSEFCYSFADIDEFSRKLGIPWALAKDLTFAVENIYHGMVWNIAERTVALEEQTRVRYLASLEEWRTSRTHTLLEAQRLAGRLQHITYIIPHGRPYLSEIYRFMGLYDARDSDGRPMHHAEKRLTPGRGCPAEIEWWISKLRRPNIKCIIPHPINVIDIGAFSDASSKIGIGIIIGVSWAAWRLLPGWRDDRAYPHDIQWAEAIGFEFACRYIFGFLKHRGHIRFWCDNAGVTEAWWKRRSRNTAVNDVFKRLGSFLDSLGVSAHTRYIESARNPADQPSRFNFSALRPAHALPPLDLLSELECLIADHRAPIQPAERNKPRPVAIPIITLPEERERRREALCTADQLNSDLVTDPRYWWEDGPSF